MNLLIAVPWDQSGGGVATVVGNLGQYFTKRGHKVFFFHPDGSSLRIERRTTRWGFPGFRLRTIPPFSPKRPVLSTLAFCLLLPVTLIQLIALIRREKIAVVNVHYPIDAFIFFALCRKLLPIKLVASIHGADIFPKGKPRGRYSLPLRFLLNSADLIVANSGAFRREFLTLFPELDDKTIVIHNGIDIERLQQPLGEGLPPKGRRYLLSVAMHNEKKGLDVLIRAFAEVAKSDSSLDLHLAGSGPLRRQLEDLTKSLALQDRVKFLGRQQPSEIAKLLHGCELFVHPALAEPFGIAVVEALACKKPVVASNTGGIPEIIEHGINGILVQPGRPDELAKAIIEVLANPQLRRAISERGYATVEKRFLTANTGGRYEQAFGGLIGQAQTPVEAML